MIVVLLPCGYGGKLPRRMVAALSNAPNQPYNLKCNLSFMCQNHSVNTIYRSPMRAKHRNPQTSLTEF
jgi:hypothetical protein